GHGAVVDYGGIAASAVNRDGIGLRAVGLDQPIVGNRVLGARDLVAVRDGRAAVIDIDGCRHTVWSRVDILLSDDDLAGRTHRNVDRRLRGLVTFALSEDAARSRTGCLERPINGDVDRAPRAGAARGTDEGAIL